MMVNVYVTFCLLVAGAVKKPKKKDKHKVLEAPLPPLLAKNKDILLVSVRERERERGCFSCGPSGLGELKSLLCLFALTLLDFSQPQRAYPTGHAHSNWWVWPVLCSRLRSFLKISTCWLKHSAHNRIINSY